MSLGQRGRTADSGGNGTLLSEAAPAVPDSNGHRQAEQGQMRTQTQRGGGGGGVERDEERRKKGEEGKRDCEENRGREEERRECLLR